MTSLSRANLNNGAAVGPTGEGMDCPSMFPAYSAYKDSGVEWAGILPVEWQILKLKRVARLQSGEFITSEAIEEDAQYPVYGGNGLRGYTVAYTHDGEFALIGRQGALCGNINYAEGKFWASEHAVVVYPEKGIVTRWLGELLRSMNLGQYSVSAAQPGLSVERIADLFIPVPSSIEQTQIARFLDHETARIDALIEEQKRLIELLKEKRQAVISHAVTKGLDPTVPMKDSGVEWLGKVPAHWDIWKFSHFAPIITCGVAATPDYFDEGVPFLSAQNVKNNRIDLSKGFKYISKEKHKELTKNRVVKNGDILLSRVGTIGEVCVVDCDFEFSIFVSLTHIRLHQSICRNEYFVFLCESKYVKSLNLAVTAFGGGVGNLNVNDLTEYDFPLPPVEEQQLLIKYISDVASDFKGLILEAEKSLDLLNERRSALISAAVTGKIDVRGWQPPASAPTPELAQEAV